MPLLEGKTAIVTGAAGGIGRGIAERLASEGAAVVIADAAPRDKAAPVVETVTRAGGKALFVQTDISRADQVADLFDLAETAFQGVDIVVNNAGITVFGPIAEAKEDDFDRVFAVNARGTFLMVREAARRLRDGGRLINISSSTVRFPLENVGIYAASKAVSRELTEIAARELGPRGITVNTVMPGPTLPGMFAGSPENVQRDAATQSPFGRIGTPADVAGVVAFLASTDSGWVSGQHIVVNGAATI